MPNPQNIAGQGFHTHPERINRLGPPKRIYTILKESGYTKSDIKDAFEEIGWQNIESLNKILEDPDKPAILKVIAKAFIKGAEKGDFRYVSEILNHVIGKPKEQTENKHLHKIIVEYGDPNNTTLQTTPGPTAGIEGETKV